MHHSASSPALIAAATVLALAVATACNKSDRADEQPANAPDAQPPHPVPAVPTQPAARAGTAAVITSGTVVETMNSGGYTYALIDTGKRKVWAAAPGTKVTVGQRTSFPGGALMKGFHSKTLNRTFDEIYFVSGFGLAATTLTPSSPTAAPTPPGHP